MTSHDKQILKRMLAQDATLGGVFDAFASRVSAILNGYSYGDGGIWSNNKLVELKVDMEVESLRKNLETHIRNNQQWAWGVSNAKNDELVNSYIKGLAISSALKEGMFARNMEAFEQFSKRKINGLTVSDRVWDISRQAKTQLEFYLESGIGNGRSAATLSRDIRQLLKEPDKLFRRVRDKNGNLVPSKPMKDYHPGQGVYRSSYMNAKRLAVSEINMSYRNADHERWGQLGFVTGIEVKLSSAHPRTDICDHMKGKYPKEFKFTGWHPFCLCFAVPVLMDKDRFMDDLVNDREINPEKITDIPDDAKAFLETNQKTIDGWNSKPIWVKDNFNGAKLEGGLKFGKLADTSQNIIMSEEEAIKVAKAAEQKGELVLYRGDIRDKGLEFKSENTDYHLDGEIKNKAGFNFFSDKNEYARDYATTAMNENIRAKATTPNVTVISVKKDVKLFDFRELTPKEAAHFELEMDKYHKGYLDEYRRSIMNDILSLNDKQLQKKYSYLFDSKKQLSVRSIINHPQTYSDFELGESFKKYLEDNKFDGFVFQEYTSGAEYGIINKKLFKVIAKYYIKK